MSKKKKDEQVEEVVEESTEGTTEQKVEQLEESMEDLFARVVKQRVRLLKNIKHHQKRYKAGEEIELTEEELAHFKKLGLVRDDQQ